MFFLSAALIFFQAGMILLAVNKSQLLVSALDGIMRRQMPAEEILAAVKIATEEIRLAGFEGLYAERLRDSDKFKRAEDEARKEIDTVPERLDALLALKLGEKFATRTQDLRALGKDLGAQTLQLFATMDTFWKTGSKSDSRLVDEARAKFESS